MHPPCRFTAQGKKQPNHIYQKRKRDYFLFNENAIPVAVNKNRSSSEGKPHRWRGRGPRRPPAARAARAQASRKCTFCTACRGKPLTPTPPADGSFAAIAAEGEKGA